MENFEAINHNIQERLRALEGQQQVMVTLLVAMIETHPRPEALRQQFAFHYETLHGRWLNSSLAEHFLDSSYALRRVLDSSFDLPRK